MILTIQGDPPLVAQLNNPAGYTGYPHRTCREQDDDEDGISVTNAQGCASLCDGDTDCVSFDLTNGNTCHLHKTCDHYSQTAALLHVWNGGCPGFPGLKTQYNTFHTLEECAEKCALEPNCVGFFRRTNDDADDDGICHVYLTECGGSDSDTKWDYYKLPDWYFKHQGIIPKGYARHPETNCQSSPRVFNNNTGTVQECANICSADNSCISFNYGIGTDTVGRCDLVTDKVSISACDDLIDDEAWNWYYKKDNFQDGETECLFMTHDKAEVRKGLRGFPTSRFW